MSYQTLEVDLVEGRLLPRGSESLPSHARALLTILETAPTTRPTGNGLERFLAAPDFPITPEQFRASMQADVWEQ